MHGRLREQLSQRDVDTLAIMDEIFDREQLEIRELRKVSAVRGCVNSETRRRVWPTLLNVDTAALLSYDNYRKLSQEPNDFRSIIATDVHRSLFHFFDATEEIQRRQQRTKLERLLNAVISYHEGKVHYYQGLHDIASILLLTLGESLAFAVLCKLTVIRLKDCTQKTLEPVAELLRMQVPILQRLDPSLARHLEQMDLPCYFAISWFITWFSHDVPHFDEVCRLFDFFLATHPLMPLYIGAVGMHAARSELLQAQEMSELHKSLVNLHVLDYLTVDEVILKAISLYHKHPPRRVIRDLSFRLRHCVTPFATLENDLWNVPSKPPVYQFRRPHKWLLHTIVGGMLGGNGLTSTGVKLVSMAGRDSIPLNIDFALSLGVGICAVAVVALKLMESDFEPIQRYLLDGILH